MHKSAVVHYLSFKTKEPIWQTLSKEFVLHGKQYNLRRLCRTLTMRHPGENELGLQKRKVSLSPSYWGKGRMSMW